MGKYFCRGGPRLQLRLTCCSEDLSESGELRKLRWGGVVGSRSPDVRGLDLCGGSEGLSESLALVIRLPGGCLCGVQAPLGQQRLGHLTEVRGQRSVGGQ